MKVLIAIDDSPYSKHVIDAARKRRWPRDTEFRIVTVVEPIANEQETLEEVEFTSTLEQLEKRRVESARKLCISAAERLRTIPDGIVHFDIRSGKPVSQILNSAIEWPATKILIGAHGRGLCPHGFLGSVSRTVSERAGCSVEVIRESSQRKTGNESQAKEAAKV